MAIKMPEDISDRVATLNEPLSVGLQAVLRILPEEKANVLLIGSRMIFYAVIASIKLLKLDCNITHFSLMHYQQELAIALDAEQIFINQNELETIFTILPRNKKALADDWKRYVSQWF